MSSFASELQVFPDHALIGESLLGSSEDAVVGLPGAVLGQGFCLFGKALGVQHGRAILVPEIAAQPK
jgi:hypothetical protein